MNQEEYHSITHGVVPDAAGYTTQVYLRTIDGEHVAIKKCSRHIWETAILPGRERAMADSLPLIPVCSVKTTEQYAYWQEPVVVTLADEAVSQRHLLAGLRLRNAAKDANIGDLGPDNLAVYDGRVVILDTGYQYDELIEQRVIKEWQHRLERD